MSKYTQAELEELQKRPEPWWPEPESFWRADGIGRVQVVCLSVDRQVGERVIAFKDAKQLVWTQTLRSFLEQFKVD